VRSLPAAIGRLADHPLVDRLLAGKAWIGVVAFALIGIVTLQLLLLQLNRSIGHDLEHQGVLQRQNATLAIENSELAVGERIQHQASGLGMTLIPASALRFLSVHRGATAKALAALSVPVQQTTAGGEGAPAAGGEQSETGSEAASSSSSASTGEGESGSSGEGAGESASGEAARSSEPTRSSESESGGGAEHSESHTSSSGEASSAETATGGGSSAPAG
jgi:hypothetical protein